MNPSDEHEERKVGIGQELEVTLESSPGSGAIWQHEDATPAIKFLDEARINLREGIGGAVRQVFRFRAEQSGAHELHFEFKRPWEKEVRRSKIVKVTVG